MPLLLDTGIVYALADRDDAWHARARSFLEARDDVLLIPVTTLPEIAYLLRSRLGEEVETAFVRSLTAGELAIEALAPADLERTLEVMAGYPQLGFVDATLVAIAERLRLASLVTTDRRHFAAVRPRHRELFELLP